MPFQLSPGVAVVEKDFSSIVPAVSSSVGAFAGMFKWGPVLDPVTISSENLLVQRFGAPNDSTAQSFFTAANFLSYTNNMLVVRVDSTSAKNAVSTGTAVKIKNFEQYLTSYAGGEASVGEWAAKYPGTLGNAIRVAMADSTTFKNFVLTGTSTCTTAGAVITGVGTAFLTELHKGAVVKNSTGAIIGVVASIASNTSVTLTTNCFVAVTGSAIKADWAYADQFDFTPSTTSTVLAAGGSNDELHVIVLDETAAWSGAAGTVLEKFSGVSKALDAKKADGTNNYYKDVINSQSKYIWWMDHTANVDTSVNGSGTSGVAWGSNAAFSAFKDLTGAMSGALTGGVDDYTSDDGDYQDGFAIFQNAEQYDISLIATGKVSAATAKWVVQNVAEYRKDCVAFVSPVSITDGSIIINSATPIDDIIAFRTGAAFNVDSSYAVLDSGYKYQYDRYNDKYRWVPLNGDMAGLCARTDYTDDPWYSPGGLNRGQVKNVVKLAVNPNKTDRDNLYKNGVNPVVNFPGQGCVLFGDKTLQSKPSAFDRINVRRLFIVLEKAIAIAAKYQLFEFNDSFTRAQFKNLVEPFLRDVQGRRGVTDFRVKCDDANNTGEVIDRNEFVADIFIKPNRSINFITLNFVAARSSVSFEEIGA